MIPYYGDSRDDQVTTTIQTPPKEFTIATNQDLRVFSTDSYVATFYTRNGNEVYAFINGEGTHIGKLRRDGHIINGIYAAWGTHEMEKQITMSDVFTIKPEITMERLKEFCDRCYNASISGSKS